MRPQVQPSEEDEYHRGDDQVGGQGGQEEDELVAGEVLALDDAVDDRAVDADRGEAAGLGAVHHHRAHQERADPVSRREAQCDRGDDRDRGRADRADRRERAGQREHHPGDERHPTPHEADGGVHQPVGGAVGAGDREEVRDTDQDDEQVTGEAGEDAVRVEIGDETADPEGRGEGERAHVDGTGGGDDEHHDEDEDRDQFGGHTGSRRWAPERLGAPGSGRVAEPL